MDRSSSTNVSSTKKSVSSRTRSSPSKSSTNESMQKGIEYGQRTSLLVDWSGMELLQHYKDMKSGNDTSMSSEFNLLEAAIKSCWDPACLGSQNEVFLTDALVTKLKSCFESCKSSNPNWNLTIPKASVGKGNVFDWSESKPRAVDNNCTTDILFSNISDKHVSVLEVGIGKNAGDKKIGQGLDYAALLSSKAESNDDGKDFIVVWTLSIQRGNTDDKQERKRDIDRENKVETRYFRGINVEVFLAEITKTNKCPKARFAFLWREHYEIDQSTPPSKEQQDIVVEKSSGAIARALCTVSKFTQLKNADNHAYQDWQPMGDDCARCKNANGTELVYKIFDNRFIPTYRSPELWFTPDIQTALCVEEHLSYSEVGHLEQEVKLPELGSPNRKLKQVEFGLGSVMIIRYNFMKGTHIPETVGPFIAIADQLNKLHESGLVHGDIRLYNMVFGDGANAQEGWLIDFDLGGSLLGKRKRKYPPGYVSIHTDVGERAGEEGEEISIRDDWHDFVGVLNLAKPPLKTDEEMDQMTSTQLREYNKSGKNWDDFMRFYITHRVSEDAFSKDMVSKFLSQLKKLGNLPLKLDWSLQLELNHLGKEVQ